MHDDAVPGIGSLEEVAVRPVGTVYRAVMTESKRTVAVTIVDAMLTDQQRDRFEHESRAMASVGGHPHVLTVLDSGITAKGHPYLVTEYLTRTLADFLVQNGSLRWQESVALGVEAASGLAAAHQVGVLHRDVTPENVLMAYGDVPRLAGFGLARFATAGAAPGTRPRIAHSAPEVVQGKSVDERSDVYSLASVIQETITGKAPFLPEGEVAPEVLIDRIATAPPPSLVGYGVPPEVDAVIAAALAKDPDQRPASAKAFAQQLLAAAKSAGETTAAMRRPTEAMAAVVGTAGAAAAGAGGAGTSGNGGGPNTAALPLATPPSRPPRRWVALAAFAAAAALLIAGLGWIVSRGDDDSAAGGNGGETPTETTAPLVPMETGTDPESSTTDEAVTSTTDEEPTETTAAVASVATVAASTAPSAAPTSTIPGGFQLTGITTETGSTTFRIPADGENYTFVYEVTVAQNADTFWCPVRTRLKSPDGPNLAKIDLGQCFPPNDPPNKFTFKAWHVGTNTFELWMCDGESTSRTCPGTRSQNSILITVIAEPPPPDA